MNNKYEKTYCNPISLPGYAYAGKDWGFLQQFLPVTGRWQEGNQAEFYAPVRPYRSLSDPDIMYYEGKWYMYGSSDVCYVTSDMLRWEAHPLLPRRFNADGVTRGGVPLSDFERSLYESWIAATAVPFRGKIYMVHSTTNAIYVSDSPLGPFEKYGDFVKPDGSEFWCDDPALFEDNGRLYLYFGCGVATGIQGVELNPENPCQLLSEPVRLIEFRSETGWECTGARYQDTSVGWIEGCDMFKHNGRYYLIYAANGTVYDSYNMGVYYSDESPLSGFKPQENGPFCEKRLGICKGSGHGCVTKGPGDSIFVFYTSVAACTHMYERRIGMDRVFVNQAGELEAVATTDSPQWAPGVAVPERAGYAADIRPLNYQHAAWATSAAPGRDPFYATDESMITWWMPDEGDTLRQIIVDLRTDYEISASRVLWKESGFDEDRDILPGPVKYKIEVTDDISSGSWRTVLDMSQSEEDYLNDYRSFASTRGNKARLTILETPKGASIGVISFILYGKK